MPDCEGCGRRHQVCSLSWTFSSTCVETYWTVTFTTVVMVVEPDVPVTVNVARPFGVPGGPELVVADVLQPTITEASVNTARHMLNAKRRHGACPSLIIPVTNTTHPIPTSLKPPHRT